ncbi:ABC transporter ATP-binding protein [Pseudooceanicola sediminis]|uniref:ABC transporter ATP-binding protein n=1 Tax=Pseudooceanicola sediminis TaxID=2211117 RepID=A0A399IZY4_9RHOB|nr:ABC transporter ATP-binding protein [Pseudooceanicola sediminis]KAA2313908.1 ABC transporter ATP-binding protein [Puniceibacterium sp. HSS470]RII38723.1 ABC transporter ATP-binding protein [Pseudooceanicola sediminis]|tara:strand:+ start:31295 stop:33142 length:1848 start_codon:yes stop_codon:yes gene_type:complete
MFAWFERRIDPYPDQPPAMPPRSLVRFVLHYSRGVLPWLVFLAVGSGLIAVIEVMLFGWLGQLIDRLSDTPREVFWAQEGARIAMMAVVLVIAMPLLNTVTSLVLHQSLMGNFPQRIRWQAHRYLLRQSVGYFQDEFAGRIAQRLMQTALAVREVAMKVMDVGSYVLIYFLGAMGLAASQDWRLAVPFVLWAVAYGAMLWQIVPRLGRVAQQQADARSGMTGRIVDSYTNIATVKLFSHSDREERWMREGMDRFLGTVHSQMRLSSLQDIVLNLINVWLVASVAGVGLWLWSVGEVAVGAVAVAVPLALRLNNMAHWIMWEFAALFENIGTVRDGITSLALPRDVRDAPDATPLVKGPGEVRFDHVTFRYSGLEGARPMAVLEDLSLHLRPGERVGLVGRSGAGKSTLINLLLRFHDIEEGSITIDGQRIESVTQDSLRAAIGVVTQDSSLLHRSVRENIAYGRPDASEAQIQEALRLAEADSFVPDLSDSMGRRGLDAHVGERGVKLSGGQRQRIAIARVALKDAPILILDEATSALDSEVEAAIQSRLEVLMQGKTVIAIAHRLSTIAAMDRLIVMDKGRIIEQGTHGELLSRGGLYARLWQRQSGGFLAADE